MRNSAGFASGLIFGLGLLVSGMANPAKVLAFLNIAGAWDPSLALVMAAAVAIAALGFRFGNRLPKPLFAKHFASAPSPAMDVRLVSGAILFGAGWGLTGFCPGPAFIALASGVRGAVIFTGAMIVGMVCARAFTRIEGLARYEAADEAG